MFTVRYIFQELADEFCDGKTDLDTFLSEYIPKRSEAYIKKAKIEKASELFRQFSSTGSAPYPSHSVPQNNYVKPQTGSVSPGYGGYGMGSTPYPAPEGPYGGSGMPMPPYYHR